MIRNMMVSYILRLFATLIIVDVTLGQWSTAGQPQSFTCVTNKVIGTNINWKQLNETDVEFFCQTFQNFSCAPRELNNNDLYSAIITSNSSSYISVFTIKYVTPIKHNTIWLCIPISVPAGAVKTVQYDLKVYATAENPTCDNVKLLNQSTIQIDCSTQNVFPGSICDFFIKTNGSSEKRPPPGLITYNHEQNVTTKYYKTNCTYIVSAEILGPGSHAFRVDMYPNISSERTNEITRESLYTAPIEIVYPKAFLKADCQANGYIKEQLRSKCTCYSNNTSILSTTIIWYKSGSKVTSNGTLEFQALRNESFECTASNSLNWMDSIKFEPNVSYGPDIIRFDITERNFNTCNGTDVAISGSCFVSESNPESSVYLNISNSLTEIKSSKNNREYIFNKTMLSTGVFKVSCLANSTEYSISANVMSFVTIKGPPDVPRIFVNKNAETNHHSNNLLEVTNGDTITCEAKGGYPISKNISLTCGHEEISVINKDQVFLILNVSNIKTGTCECIVWHESKCQQNRTIVQLKFSETVGVSSKNFDNIYIGVGVTGGFILMIIALLFIITSFSQYLSKNNSSEMTQRLVDNGEIYFIKEENSTIDTSIYPAYTNVLTTMSSAMEAPKNLKSKENSF